MRGLIYLVANISANKISLPHPFLAPTMQAKQFAKLVHVGKCIFYLGVAAKYRNAVSS